jgi:cell division septation protein DedD
MIGTNTDGSPTTPSVTLTAIDSSAPTDDSTIVTMDAPTTSDTEPTTVETTMTVPDDSSTTDEPTATPTDGAAGLKAMGGEVLGVVGLAVVLAAL